MSPVSGTLDKIIEIAGKVQQVTDIVAPGLGGSVGVGVFVAKALRDQWNAAHPAEPVTLPADDVLIQRLADTSTRVVTTGVAFLESGG
jgi:glucose-6-phosphate isomerase